MAVDHRQMPSLIARAGLLEMRGDWIGALADLDMALTNRPDDARLRLASRRAAVAPGRLMRGLPDYEARLELPNFLVRPALPRWQGDPVDRLLILSRAARHRGRRGHSRHADAGARPVDAVDAVRAKTFAVSWLDYRPSAAASR
jgi:hypothetical protein